MFTKKFSRLYFVSIELAKWQKSSVEECIFDYMASHIECRFNKNTLLQGYFFSVLVFYSTFIFIMMMMVRWLLMLLTWIPKTIVGYM